MLLIVYFVYLVLVVIVLLLYIFVHVQIHLLDFHHLESFLSIYGLHISLLFRFLLNQLNLRNFVLLDNTMLYMLWYLVNIKQYRYMIILWPATKLVYSPPDFWGIKSMEKLMIFFIFASSGNTLFNIKKFSCNIGY